MKRRLIILLIAFVSFGFVMVQSGEGFIFNPTARPIEFNTPKGWPSPQYPFDSNRITQEGFELGKKLFYDGRLSKDGNFSCGSCHQQFAAFSSYEHDFSHGINNSFTNRNAPGLFNLAWKKEFMWDGGINHLDLQPLAPITAQNEMGEDINAVLEKLRGDAEYRKMFKAAFGSEKIDTRRMTQALSQFLLMMISSNSKYDKVMRGEDTFILPQRLGYEIFKKKCASCHVEPLFTDFSYRNIGLPLNPVVKDYGRMNITGKPEDSLKFMVPSLRNVQLTAPYAHDGRFMFLDQALDHYRKSVADGPTTDPQLKGNLYLSNFEIGQLKAFLFTLTDTTFTKDKRFGEQMVTSENFVDKHVGQ